MEVNSNKKCKTCEMKYKKEDLIDAIIKMRVEKGLATKTIVQDFLQKEMGYKQSYAYTLMKQARDKIREIYIETNGRIIDEAVAQLEDMYERCMKQKNIKQALEVRKELNKLLGLYEAEKIDITTNGKDISPQINITIHKPNEPES